MKLYFLYTFNIDPTFILIVGIVVFFLIINIWDYFSKIKTRSERDKIVIIEKDGLLKEKDSLLREKDLIYQNDIKENNLINMNSLTEKDLQIEKMIAEAKEVAGKLATTQFEEWKTKELEAHRKVIIEAAINSAQAELGQWKLISEKDFRKDAITRSMGVNFGKITEHLLPFSEHLSQFDPRDVRFIGSPVDLMIFDGATRKADKIDIYLVEIKTGTGKLSKKQQVISDAIADQRVYWKPILVPKFKWDVPDDPEDTEEPDFQDNPQNDEEDFGEAFSAWK